MSISTVPSAGLSGGGLPPSPLPRDAQITVTTRTGDRVVVATWATCAGVADFIARVLGDPGSRVEADRG